MPLSARSSSPSGLTAAVSTVLLLAVSLGTASASGLGTGSKPASASPAPDRAATASTRDAGTDRVDDPLEAIVPTPPPPQEEADSSHWFSPGDSIQYRRYAIEEDRQYVRETIYTRLAAGWGLSSNTVTIQPSGED